MSIFLISLINFWFAEDWLIFTVEWTGTSFSISNFCHPNGTNWYTVNNYDTISIKIWNSTFIDNFQCAEYLVFRNNQSIFQAGHSNPTSISANIPGNEDEWQSSSCLLEQIEPIVLNGSTTISKIWDFKLMCDINFKNWWPHTITIKDPLYSTENYNSWQITKINIWLTGSYIAQEYANEGLIDITHNYSSGNVTAITQMRWLPKLTTLDLSNNRIQSTDFLNSENTNNLHEINLSNNQISSIDSNNWKCSLLEKLNLSSNQISTIKFRSLTNLKYLDLSLNRLDQLDKNIFSTLKNLTWLDLQWQKSENLTIQQYAFSWLNKLENLYLQDNKIGNLEWRTFHWLTNIKSLNLNNCKIWAMNPDTNNSDYYTFDNFGINNAWTIDIILSNNLLNTIPESLERIISWHYTFLNLSNSNQRRLWENDNPELHLNLINNPINYVKIKTKTVKVGENTFQRYWFSQSWYNKYKRDIKDNSWNIITWWEITSDYWEPSIDISIDERTKWTFNVYLLNNNDTVASDSIEIGTTTASTINIFAENSTNQLESGQDFKKRNIYLNFVWDPYGDPNVYYTYTIRKDTKSYLTWTYTDNNYNKTFFFENWTYYLNIKMCEIDSECTTTNWLKVSKSIKVTVSVPYGNNILNITYPENNTEIEDKLDHISRTHDRNYCDENNPYLSEMSWFYYEITDKNWINHLSWTKKLNNECSETWYDISTTDLNLPNWKYTITIKEIDKHWNAIKSENITFQKWKILTVSFYTNWWSSIESAEIGSWEKLSKPRDPTKNGFIFTWWYTDSSFTNKYNFDSPVTQNFTLYAKRERDPAFIRQYELIIYYNKAEWWTASETQTFYITGWYEYSIVSPTVTNYTPNLTTVSWTMPYRNETRTVTYTKNENWNSWWGGWWGWGGGWTSTSSTYTLTIYYKYNDWWTASTTYTQRIAGWNRYSVSSPYISNYTADTKIVEWTMPNYNKTIYVYYTKNKSNNYLSVNAINKYPSTNEWVKLNIVTDSDYTEKINFSKIQYRSSSSSSWSSISRTSSTYISDYSYDWSVGYYRMTRSDYGYATLDNLIKFKKSGYYRIYITDVYGNESYIDINVDETNDSWNGESDISLSTNNNNPDKYEPIDITLKTDNYIGKLKLYAKYKDSSNSWVKISNTSTIYFSDYSNIWEIWYYNMVSSDKWKKSLSDLVTFKKEWSYRIYAEDEKWYLNYIQINVETSDNSSATSTSNSKSNDYDIESVLQSLLNKDINKGTTESSPENILESLLGDSQSTTDTSEEIYIARSCKQYKLQYNTSLNAFTSPDMKKSEYFINKDYLKRYLDSKNPQKSDCPINSWWISTPYNDISNNSSSFTAPNGKVYSISNQNWSYSSTNFTSNKSFATLAEIKKFIKDRNPLIWMGK